MSQTNRSLKEWQSQGLIAAEQVRRIQDYENSKSSNNWILTGLLIFLKAGQLQKCILLQRSLKELNLLVQAALCKGIVISMLVKVIHLLRSIFCLHHLHVQQEKLQMQ
ncbi:MAG: hypothetical protein KBD78_13045 [Oligoflexales bacterium]|nr:hypothetical protein [Oligoflexales bacterium]